MFLTMIVVWGMGFPMFLSLKAVLSLHLRPVTHQLHEMHGPKANADAISDAVWQASSA